MFSLFYDRSTLTFFFFFLRVWLFKSDDKIDWTINSFLESLMALLKGFIGAYTISSWKRYDQTILKWNCNPHFEFRKKENKLSRDWRRRSRSLTWKKIFLTPRIMHFDPWFSIFRLRMCVKSLFGPHEETFSKKCWLAQNWNPIPSPPFSIFPFARNVVKSFLMRMVLKYAMIKIRDAF